MKSKLLQNTKAGIYLRLSNDDERTGESLSIENQRRILEKYVMEQGFEFVTVDKCPGKYSKAPREIHIYYKLIDKQPIPEKKYVNNLTCEDC